MRSVSGNNSATLTLSGTEAQINATLVMLSYQGGLNFNGSDMLDVLFHRQQRIQPHHRQHHGQSGQRCADEWICHCRRGRRRKGTQFTFPLPANTFNDVDGDAPVYSATLSSDGAALPQLAASITRQQQRDADTFRYGSAEQCDIGRR